MSEQVVDVALTGRGVGQVEGPVGVGGADDPVTSPRDDEQQALLGLGDDASGTVDPVSGNDEVDPLGCPNLELAQTTDHLLDLIGPHAGGVDDLAGSDLEFFARL